VCINFSTFEGGPQTFAESSLCGTPMLIRSTNELSKLIPCFKGETREDFIDTLKFLKKNRDICRQRGKEARNFVLNNFTYKDTAKKFANFFLKLKNK
jgi:glycosyltransferase involved in cell wall biosynthesis